MFLNQANAQCQSIHSVYRVHSAHVYVYTVHTYTYIVYPVHVHSVKVSNTALNWEGGGASLVGFLNFSLSGLRQYTIYNTQYTLSGLRQRSNTRLNVWLAMPAIIMLSLSLSLFVHCAGVSIFLIKGDIRD